LEGRERQFENGGSNRKSSKCVHDGEPNSFDYEFHRTSG
jgi:hypothetical protein